MKHDIIRQHDIKCCKNCIHHLGNYTGDLYCCHPVRFNPNSPPAELVEVDWSSVCGYCITYGEVDYDRY